MGPRLFSRGRLRVPSVLREIPAIASMGPRLFSRGRFGLIYSVSAEELALQWGRGCSAAEGVGQIGHSARNGC